MANITKIDPSNLTSQVYNPEDKNLISSFDIDTALLPLSYIEFFIYNNGLKQLYKNHYYTNYTVTDDGQSAGKDSISRFNISPINDIQNLGYSDGEYIAYYNFLNKEIGNTITKLFISEISFDRTEVRLDSTALSNSDKILQTNSFIYKRKNSNYFVDFYLDFGANDLIIANNVHLDGETTPNPTILIKLYEPLPSKFSKKSELWVVTALNPPEAFRITFPPEPIKIIDSKPLSGPNLNIPLKEQTNNSSLSLSYNDILSGTPTSSLNQMDSLLVSKSLDISVDYTDFNNFIHFSSAKTRLENFHYKVGLLENYSASIAELNPTTGSLTSITIIESNVNDIIKNFDKFEYFLYYNSGSDETWPKTTSKPPYLLSKTNTTQLKTWFGSDDESNSNYGGRILTASFYDNENKDQLYKSIPQYLRDDSSNRPYELFVDMVAQYYDNIWVYTKDITQKYNADNRLDYGVSKDLVADAIRDFGVKLYQNNFSKDDLYTAFLGLTPSGSLFPFPEITSSVPAPTGFEYVNTLISASKDIIPLDDVNKSLYKRIYHNIPYLLKSKGTVPGLRALITSYGIPDTILRISEFGGKDKVDANDYDYYFNKFNYAFDTKGNNFISTNFCSQSISLSTSSISYPMSASQSGSYTISPAQTGIWTEIQRITGSEDGQTARIIRQPSGGFITDNIVPNHLFASNYGFNIPAAATIKGFEATIMRSIITASGAYNPLRNIKDKDLYLSKNTSSISEHFQGDNKADTTTEWTRHQTTASYGSSTDLWGQTWTPTEVNLAGFGIQFVPTLSGSGVGGVKAHADFIGLNVYYNIPTCNSSPLVKSVEFRFKAEDFPPTNLSQSLWSTYTSSSVGLPGTDLTLEYAGSGSISGSYDGSIKDPYYQYAYLKFYPSASDTTNFASVYLPFFNGDWWSVMITSGSSGHQLFAKNKIYNGKDGTQLGYQSSSFVENSYGIDQWNQAISSYFATSSLFPGFSGSLQEIRYYNTILSESRFNDYVMNPLSIEGNTINSSPNELFFRAPLGSELGKSTSLTQISIHPKITGSWIPTQSFGNNSNYHFDTAPSYSANTEYYFLDQPIAGIKNRITDKVRFEDNVVPAGDTLSSFRRVTQQTEASASYTPNINLLEVAFSPQNQINDDIIGQLGYFNLGDYIGDPRQRSSSLDYYPDLNNLRDAYFEKYIKNYDLVDFVRLIKFFDNSLFKMIKDFIPARTSLASGLVIKQHLLERNKYPQPQLGIDTCIAKNIKELGDNLITNGGFNTDSDWTKQTGWSISLGVADFDGADYKYLGQSINITSGSKYQITFTNTGNTSPDSPLLVYLGGEFCEAPHKTTTGINFYYLNAGGTDTDFRIYPGAIPTRWSGSIDNVVVREVLNKYNQCITQQDLSIEGTFKPQWRDYAASQPRYPIPSTSSIVHLVGGTGGNVEPYNLPPKYVKFEFTSSGQSSDPTRPSAYTTNAKTRNPDSVANWTYWKYPHRAEGTPNGNGSYTNNLSVISGFSEFLDCRGFKFNVPSSAYGIGVKATITKEQTSYPSQGTTYDYIIQLITGSDHTLIGNNLASSSVPWSRHPIWESSSYGIACDSGLTWGLAGQLTPSIVNSNEFGIRIQASSSVLTPSEPQAIVDGVHLELCYYLEPNLKTHINSDVRGVLQTIKNSSSITETFTSSLFEAYDGENFYITVENLAGSSSRQLSWETEPDVKDIYKISKISSSFTSVTEGSINPFIGYSPSLSGDKVRWQSSSGYYAVRYAPQVNPILTSGGYYKATNAQQWQYSNTTLSGSIPQIHNTQDEFYNGIFTGSTILVTNGELNPECDVFKKFDPSIIPYAIRFYHTLDYGVGNEPSYSSAAWSNVYNRPLPGYISMQGYVNSSYSPTQVFSTVNDVVPQSNIKISRIDGNGIDQSITLSQIEKIQLADAGSFSSIAYSGPYQGDPLTLKVHSITPYLNYFQYSVYWPFDKATTQIDRSIPIWSLTASYSDGDGVYISSSGGTNQRVFQSYTDNSSVPGILYRKVDGNKVIPGIWPTSPTYINTFMVTADLDLTNALSLEGFLIPTYFESDLQVQITGSITGSNNVGVTTGGFNLWFFHFGGETFASMSSADMGLTLGTTYTSSFMGDLIIPMSSSTQLHPGNPAFSCFFGPGTSEVDGNFGITASLNDYTFKMINIGPHSVPYSKKQNQIVPTPFFGDNDFSKALDCQPLLNNVENNRKNPFLQEVDYNAGLITPTNISVITSETATKASVPESNYTILKSKNPRYEGCKTTSQMLNKWSKGDINTYGKEPTVESLTNLMTFCSWVDNAFPERNNTLKANIKYIINDDGTVNEPNLTEKSITNIQFSFPQQQNCIIALKDNPLGNLGMGVLNGIKKIVKGGYRIEPILYSQSGSLYSLTGSVYWTGSVFESIIKSNFPIGDFGGSAKTTSSLGITTGNNRVIEFTEDIVSSPYYSTSDWKYTIPQLAVDSGVELAFNYDMVIVGFGPLPQLQEFQVDILYYNGTITSSMGQYVGDVQYGPTRATGSGAIGAPVAGGDVWVEVTHLTPSSPWPIGVLSDGMFEFSQDLIGGNLTFTPLSSSIWGFPDNSDTSIITASINDSSSLNQSYGRFYQRSIPNSLFKDISNIWELEKGDEFRFEDREDRTYMVESFIPPNEHPLGTLEVQLSGYIPSESVNLDHFLIRRYVEDASSILIEGSIPIDEESGEAFIKPEYITKPIDENIDESIENLTSKGLL